jgi:hypothetical protein
MRRPLILLLPLCLRLAAAQTPPPPAPQLSPQAAYDQASTPIEITRRSKANWSEIEKAALAVAVDQAKDACLVRSSVPYTGDDLIAYARLCDLGQQWNIVFSAATKYINSKDAAKPQLEQAYAFEVIADLNLQQWKIAGSACTAMLRSVPYGSLTDEVTTTTIRYLQFAFLAEALDLSFQRQPYLLKLIGSSQPAATPPATTPPAAAQPVAAPAIPLHTLIRHALDYAALQQYNNQPDRAGAAIAEIDQAMPVDPPPDEAILIAADRRQYAMLGTHLPDLPATASLLSSAAPRHVTFGAVTVLVLFPPWCAQCLRQEFDMAPALLRQSERNVHMYGLLADHPSQPAKPAPHPTAAHHAITQDAHPAEPSEQPETPRSAEDQLRGTPTLVVDPSTLAEFNANDFPFLIATDSDGVIRLMVSAAPDNTLVKDGPVDQIVDTIADGWPPPGPKPPSPSK